MRVLWVVIALAAACCAAPPTFAVAANYKLVIGQSKLPVDATWKSLAKWVEARGGHLVYSGPDDPTTVLTFELPLADPASHSLKGYADCGKPDTGVDATRLASTDGGGSESWLGHNGAIHSVLRRISARYDASGHM